jgi:hypothetical protein
VRPALTPGTEFTAGACRNESCNWLTLRSELRRYRSTLDGECSRATRPLFLASKFRVVLSFHAKIVLNAAVSRVARRGVVAQTRAAALQEVADQLDSLRGAINGLSRVAEAIAAVPAKERSKADSRGS